MELREAKVKDLINELVRRGAKHLRLCNYTPYEHSVISPKEVLILREKEVNEMDLKELRRERGLSKQEATMCIPISKSALFHFEEGLDRTPDWAIDELAKVYGVSKEIVLAAAKESEKA